MNRNIIANIDRHKYIQLSIYAQIMPSGTGENKGHGPPDFRVESEIFSALSVPIRLKILDMISCGEICACDLLENLSISQPTLSHHMKVLMECGLVTGRKNSTWMHYSINEKAVDDLHNLIRTITHDKDNCVCYKSKKKVNNKKERCIS
jgi:ArsR family transcriptional regulator, arsenate/arsenite/antimonite-responsive transcriptional repressor